MTSFGLCLNIENYCFFKYIDVTRFTVFLSICALLALSSCAKKAIGKLQPVPIVQRMISDTSSSGYSLVSSYNIKSTAGPIAVLGMPEDVMRVTEELLTSDYCNNVSGRPPGDGLPDFAGETVLMMLDLANSPYMGKADEEDGVKLREVTVRNFLSALDTIYYRSPYETEEHLIKRKAKLILIASSLSSFYGLYDIDTLCKSAKKAVPVFSSLGSAVKSSIRKAKSGLSIVWASPGLLREAEKGEAVENMFIPISKGDVERRFKDLLDKCEGAGKKEKIASIILEDNALPIDSLKNFVQALKNTEEGEMLVYKKMLSPDFEFILPEKAVAQEAYSYLRKVNGFTHKIEYPGIQALVSLPSPDKYSYIYVEMKDRYFEDSLFTYMSNFAPKTFSLYVR